MSSWLESETIQSLLKGASSIAQWASEHRPEIEAIGEWSAVSIACEETGLYMPPHEVAWDQVAKEINSRNFDVADLIISLYAPRGPAFTSLSHELLTTPILQARHHEVTEILDSLEERRYYVVICGALPLIEYALSKAAGRWKQPDKHELEKRLKDDDFSEDEQDALFIDMAAVGILTRSIPEIWERKKPPNGGKTTELNRQLVLHGTASGWENMHNAMRTVLLLSATVRVAPLLLAAPAMRQMSSEQ